MRRRGAHVEPHGTVEAEDLVQQHPRQFMLEDLGVGLRGEVPVLQPGRRVGAHDPVDELAQGPFAGGATQRTTEVLARDDVRGVHRPEVGELHPALLEVDRTVPPVGHDDVPQLPGDLVVGMHAGRRVDTSDRQAAGLTSGPARLRATGLGHGAPRLAGTASGGYGRDDNSPTRELSGLRPKARDRGLEVRQGLEGQIHRGEPQVGDLVKNLQWAENRPADLVRGNLGRSRRTQPVLDQLSELGQRIGLDRSALTCPAHTRDHLRAAERLGHTAALNHPQRCLLDRREPTAAGRT